MKRLTIVVALLCALIPATTQAQERPAERYAQQSFSLLSTQGIVGTPTYTGVFAGGSGVSGLIGLGGTLRVVVSHFVIQPGIGLGVGLSTGSAGFVLTPSLGLGGAVAVAPNVALSPMVVADFGMILSGSGGSVPVFIPIMAQLPVAIYLGRNGMIEPYVGLGAVVVSVPGGSTAGFVFALGYRLGVTF